MTSLLSQSDNKQSEREEKKEKQNLKEIWNKREIWDAKNRKQNVLHLENLNWDHETIWLSQEISTRLEVWQIRMCGWVMWQQELTLYWWGKWKWVHFNKGFWYYLGMSKALYWNSILTHMQKFKHKYNSI